MVTISYITLIINTSIVTKVSPESWKYSIIIPIRKPCDTDEPTKLRPININLLSILSKKLEKVISIQLSEYLEIIIYEMKVNMPIAITAAQNKYMK